MRFAWIAAGIPLAVVLGTILLATILLAGCGNNNISDSRGHRLEKGVYETHLTTQEGRKIVCLVLTKEFSSGDRHALSITCPDFLNAR